MGYIKKRIKNKLRILIDKLCDIEEMKRTLFYNTNKIEEISKQVSSNLEMQKKIDWFQYCNIYHNPNDFFNIKRIIQEWVSGYEFKVFKPVDGTAVMDTVLLCEYKG